MKYSQQLINGIKELYPSNGLMQAHASKGNIILGRFLNDVMPIGFTVGEIIKATSLEDLKQTAKQYQQKQALYDLWCQEVADNNTRKDF